MKGGSDRLTTNKTPSHSGAHTRRRKCIGLRRCGAELMGVMLEAWLPDVRWFGRSAGRSGGADAFITKVLAVKLRDGDTSSGIKVFTLLVRLLLHTWRRRGSAGLPLATHGDGRLQDDSHAHHSHTDHGTRQPDTSGVVGRRSVCTVPAPKPDVADAAIVSAAASSADGAAATTATAAVGTLCIHSGSVASIVRGASTAPEY